MGVGPGALPSDAFMMGIDPMAQRQMMEEALEAILALLEGSSLVTRDPGWFTLRDARTQLRPYSDPCFEIAVAAQVSPAGPRAAGRFGLSLLSIFAIAWRLSARRAPSRVPLLRPPPILRAPRRPRRRHRRRAPDHPAPTGSTRSRRSSRRTPPRRGADAALLSADAVGRAPRSPAPKRQSLRTSFPARSSSCFGYRSSVGLHRPYTKRCPAALLAERF